MTRFLVPRLQERMGDFRGCTGATMEDGTRYRANRRGAFDVERADHARAIKRDPEIAGDIVAETFHAHMPGARACSCGPTRYYPFTKACPRCGGPTVEVDE